MLGTLVGVDVPVWFKNSSDSRSIAIKSPNSFLASLYAEALAILSDCSAVRETSTSDAPTDLRVDFDVINQIAMTDAITIRPISNANSLLFVSVVNDD